ncbi:hypothetical protein LXL04_023359 [Taraxacum kok-saghyz]
MSAFFSKSSLNCRRKVAENQPLLNDHQEDDEELQNQQYLIAAEKNSSRRIASLDVFLGLSIFLMVLVDYGGSNLPVIAPCLCSFSLLEYLLRLSTRKSQTDMKPRGYLHGITSLTYGVDIEKIRLFGILQQCVKSGFHVKLLKRNHSSGFIFGTDWQFKDLYSLSSLISENGTTIHTVRCSNRGDLGPGQVSDSSPSWCYAPFEPEGILRCVGRMPTIKKVASSTRNPDPAVEELKAVVGAMAKIIQENIPNSNLSVVLSKLNIKMPGSTSSAESHHNGSD